MVTTPRFTDISSVLRWCGRDWDHTAIFVGSGISHDAPSNLPTWSRFVERLTRQTSGVKRGELATLAPPDQLEILRAAHASDSHWFDQLRLIFDSGALPNDYHVLLSRLPDPLIITTNYDNLLEAAFKYRYGGHVHVATNPSSFRPGFKGAQIVKIHGTVGDPATIVASRRDYDRAYSDPHLVGFLQFVFQHYNLIFIGFSLNDPAVAHLMGVVSAELHRRSVPVLARTVFAHKESPIARLDYLHGHNVSVVPLDTFGENHKFLKRLARSVTASASDLRLLELHVVKSHRWKSDGAFSMEWRSRASGVAIKDGIREISDVYSLDTSDSKYFIHSPRKLTCRFTSESLKKATLKFFVTKQDSELHWRIQLPSHLQVGERFDYEVAFAWDNEYPPWREDLLRSSLARRPDGERRNGSWIEGVFVRYPTARLELTVLFPANYPVTASMRAGVSARVIPTPDTTAPDGEEIPVTDRAAGLHGVHAIFARPSVGKNCTVTWQMPSKRAAAGRSARSRRQG
jgi:hypothetical protein